jgi:uncharacterized protein (UPF0248 family)
MKSGSIDGIDGISMNAKDVLSELKWRVDRDLDRASVHYVHRGAPDDEKVISGSEIIDLETSFFSTAEAMVPYHRIFRVEYENEVLFERKKR